MSFYSADLLQQSDNRLTTGDFDHLARPPSGRGHNYETINVSDKAIAFLGDQYRSGDSWHIQELTVNVQHDPSNSTDGLIRGIKRRILTSLVGDESQEDYVENHELTSQRPLKKARKVPPAGLWIRQELDSSNRPSSKCPSFRDRIIRGFLRPRKAGTPPEPAAKKVTTTCQSPCDGAVIQRHNVRPDENILGPALPLALLAALIARNVSLVTIQHLLQRMQRDPLFPVVSFVIGCWLMKLYSTIQRQAPGGLSGDCVWFEDVYQIRVKIPLECLADANMLVGFFESHYRNTSAEQFVIDKQYNLFLGDRNGTPSSIEEICSAKDVKDVFMAMLYRVSFDSCLNCSNKISPFRFLSEGLQRCDYCRRQYRVYFSQGIARTTSSNTASFLLPAWRQPNLLANVDGLGGMLNVDLDLQWKHQNAGRLMRPIRQSSKNWWSGNPIFNSTSQDVNESPFTVSRDNIAGLSRTEQGSDPGDEPQTLPKSFKRKADDDASWTRTCIEETDAVWSHTNDPQQKRSSPSGDGIERKINRTMRSLYRPGSNDNEKLSAPVWTPGLTLETLFGRPMTANETQEEDWDFSWVDPAQVLPMLPKAECVLYDGGDLVHATISGDIDEVRMLLDEGADIDTQAGLYGKLVQMASFFGYEDIVALLLDRGADVNEQVGWPGNALQSAAYGGHEQTVQLLIEKGAKVNAQGGAFGNALLAASGKGHANVVQVLLDLGADSAAQGGPYSSRPRAAPEDDAEGVSPKDTGVAAENPHLRRPLQPW